MSHDIPDGTVIGHEWDLQCPDGTFAFPGCSFCIFRVCQVRVLLAQVMLELFFGQPRRASIPLEVNDALAKYGSLQGHGVVLVPKFIHCSLVIPVRVATAHHRVRVLPYHLLNLSSNLVLVQALYAARSLIAEYFAAS